MSLLLPLSMLLAFAAQAAEPDRLITVINKDFTITGCEVLISRAGETPPRTNRRVVEVAMRAQIGEDGEPRFLRQTAKRLSRPVPFDPDTEIAMSLYRDGEGFRMKLYERHPGAASMHFGGVFGLGMFESRIDASGVFLEGSWEDFRAGRHFVFELDADGEREARIQYAAAVLNHTTGLWSSAEPRERLVAALLKSRAFNRRDNELVEVTIDEIHAAIDRIESHKMMVDVSDETATYLDGINEGIEEILDPERPHRNETDTLCELPARGLTEQERSHITQTQTAFANNASGTFALFPTSWRISVAPAGSMWRIQYPETQFFSMRIVIEGD